MKDGKIEVRKAPDDPACTRVSVGGNVKIGYYCTYHGTVDDSIDCLELALVALKAMQHAKIEAPLSNVRAPGMSGRS